MPRAPLPARRQAKVWSLAKVKDETQEKTEAEAHLLSRVLECRERGLHTATPEAEAKTALVMASRLMLAHNLNENDINNHSTSPNTFEVESPTVRIVSTRGVSLVVDESWVWLVTNAMNPLFEVQSHYQTSVDREYIDHVFYGISQNTRVAANAFEVVHNLICEWGRGRGGSRTSYCMGVAKGFMRMARDTKDQETLEMIKLDQEDLRTWVAKEQQKELEQRGRLGGTNLTGAGHLRFVSTGDSDLDDEGSEIDKAYDAISDTSEEFFDAKEQINFIETPVKIEKQTLLDQVPLITTTRTRLPSNSSAHTTYRGTAKDIADALIKSHHLTSSSEKAYSVSDRNAYKEGMRDARDIDIKRKRIENGTSGDEIVGVGSKRRIQSETEDWPHSTFSVANSAQDTIAVIVIPA